MKKLCFILFCIMTLTGMRCEAQTTFLRGMSNADTIAVGQPFDYQLFLTIPKDYSVDWTQFGDTLSKSIEVINIGEVMTSPIENSDNVKMSQHLTLTSFDTGYVYVPEIAISYRKSLKDSILHTLRTNEYELYVTTVEVDTTQAFKPIKDVIYQGITAREIFPWIAVVIVIACLVYLIIYLKKRAVKAPVEVVAEKKPEIPAIITARAKLAEMNDRESWNTPMIKEYYTDLTDIAREYLEGQFAIDAVEMTTSEITDAVDKLNINDLAKTKLRNTLITADFVKFAKATPSADENKRSFNDISVFVEDSYEYYQEEAKKKEEETK